MLLDGKSLWLGVEQWVPLTHSGCLDESAYLGMGDGTQFPSLEKSGLPTASFSAVFHIAAPNCSQVPSRPRGGATSTTDPQPGRQPRPGQAADTFTVLVGARCSPYTALLVPRLAYS